MMSSHYSTSSLHRIDVLSSCSAAVASSHSITHHDSDRIMTSISSSSSTSTSSTNIRTIGVYPYSPTNLPSRNICWSSCPNSISSLMCFMLVILISLSTVFAATDSIATTNSSDTSSPQQQQQQQQHSHPHQHGQQRHLRQQEHRSDATLSIVIDPVASMTPVDSAMFGTNSTITDSINVSSSQSTTNAASPSSLQPLSSPSTTLSSIAQPDVSTSLTSLSSTSTPAKSRSMVYAPVSTELAADELPKLFDWTVDHASIHASAAAPSTADDVAAPIARSELTTFTALVFRLPRRVGSVGLWTPGHTLNTIHPLRRADFIAHRQKQGKSELDELPLQPPSTVSNTLNLAVNSQWSVQHSAKTPTSSSSTTETNPLRAPLFVSLKRSLAFHVLPGPSFGRSTLASIAHTFGYRAAGAEQTWVGIDDEVHGAVISRDASGNRVMIVAPSTPTNAITTITPSPFDPLSPSSTLLSAMPMSSSFSTFKPPPASASASGASSFKLIPGHGPIQFLNSHSSTQDSWLFYVSGVAEAIDDPLASSLAVASAAKQVWSVIHPLTSVYSLRVATKHDADLAKLQLKLLEDEVTAAAPSKPSESTSSFSATPASSIPDQQIQQQTTPHRQTQLGSALNAAGVKLYLAPEFAVRPFVANRSALPKMRRKIERDVQRRQQVLTAATTPEGADTIVAADETNNDAAIAGNDEDIDDDDPWLSRGGNMALDIASDDDDGDVNASVDEAVQPSADAFDDEVDDIVPSAALRESTVLTPSAVHSPSPPSPVLIPASRYAQITSLITHVPSRGFPLLAVGYSDGFYRMIGRNATLRSEIRMSNYSIIGAAITNIGKSNTITSKHGGGAGAAAGVFNSGGGGGGGRGIKGKHAYMMLNGVQGGYQSVAVILREGIAVINMAKVDAKIDVACRLDGASVSIPIGPHDDDDDAVAVATVNDATTTDSTISSARKKLSTTTLLTSSAETVTLSSVAFDSVQSSVLYVIASDGRLWSTWSRLRWDPRLEAEYASVADAPPCVFRQHAVVTSLLQPSSPSTAAGNSPAASFAPSALLRQEAFTLRSLRGFLLVASASTISIFNSSAALLPLPQMTLSMPREMQQKQAWLHVQQHRGLRWMFNRSLAGGPMHHDEKLPPTSVNSIPSISCQPHLDSLVGDRIDLLLAGCISTMSSTSCDSNHVDPISHAIFSRSSTFQVYHIQLPLTDADSLPGVASFSSMMPWWLGAGRVPALLLAIIIAVVWQYWRRRRRSRSSASEQDIDDIDDPDSFLEALTAASTAQGDDADEKEVRELRDFLSQRRTMTIMSQRQRSRSGTSSSGISGSHSDNRNTTPQQQVKELIADFITWRSERKSTKATVGGKAKPASRLLQRGLIGANKRDASLHGGDGVEYTLNHQQYDVTSSIDADLSLLAADERASLAAAVAAVEAADATAQSKHRVKTRSRSHRVPSHIAAETARMTASIASRAARFEQCLKLCQGSVDLATQMIIQQENDSVASDAATTVVEGGVDDDQQTHQLADSALHHDATYTVDEGDEGVDTEAMEGDEVDTAMEVEGRGETEADDDMIDSDPQNQRDLCEDEYNADADNLIDFTDEQIAADPYSFLQGAWPTPIKQRSQIQHHLQQQQALNNATFAVDELAEEEHEIGDEDENAEDEDQHYPQNGDGSVDQTQIGDGDADDIATDGADGVVSEEETTTDASDDATILRHRHAAASTVIPPARSAPQPDLTIDGDVEENPGPATSEVQSSTSARSRVQMASTVPSTMEQSSSSPMPSSSSTAPPSSSCSMIILIGLTSVACVFIPSIVTSLYPIIIASFTTKPLLSLVCTLWVLLVVLIVISPVVSVLAEAGRYGKLISDSASSLSTNTRTSGSRLFVSLHAIFFAPSLYISTARSFTSYYAASALWNGWLLYECLRAYFAADHSQIRMPVMTLLREIDTMLGGIAIRPLSTSTVSHSSLQPLLLLLILFEVHVLRRLYECLFVAVFSPKSKQHVIITLMAYLYYLLCSLTPVLDSALIYGVDAAAAPFDRWLSSSNVNIVVRCCGMIVFVFGWYHQHIAHRILASLRKPSSISVISLTTVSSTPPPSTSRYSIPYGSLFQYVSMPHYFCEMLEYTALWMVCGCKFSQFLICLWVYSNLTITAVRSHHWYRQQFPNYPKQRRAVIPCIL